ncbi:MAG TPA: 2-C-methyl-D-erythritol 2,4-cyclodiphosphate synthase [Proteobacteria bacterium]|nr:2-C-methyl-D-erythritol 2,4-cyclodiphosphate synthase [bacterium BMS3Abin14]HDL53937.1 2-C-methyl-D-erythritol 2,4-cyclodiphosphate synthase [Pseudomonadota bacterium]
MDDRTRTGIGFDSHRLIVGRALVLGGVRIPYEMGLEGHSDADVLTHALMDALLGAAGMGDLGGHFPDTDDRYKGADSLTLLKKVLGLLRGDGWEAVNVDATLLAERPKMGPFIPRMILKLENAGLGPGTVNIKATTGEGMGFVGRGEGLAAIAVALIRRKSRR